MVHQSYDTTMGMSFDDCQFTEIFIQRYKSSAFRASAFQDFLITRICLPFTCPHDVMTSFLELPAGSAPDAGVQKKFQELVKEVSRTGFSE
jgi:hypothetical protein